MKKAYNTPEADLVEFGADVIATSTTKGCGCSYNDWNDSNTEGSGCTQLTADASEMYGSKI